MLVFRWSSKVKIDKFFLSTLHNVPTCLSITFLESFFTNSLIQLSCDLFLILRISDHEISIETCINENKTNNI